MRIPIYQPLGSSSHLLAQQIGQMHQQKATHTGTLDPMAEGVLVCLTGEDRFQKGTFNHDKEYLFQILVGFSTDSHDLLGLISNYQEGADLSESTVATALETFKGNLQQQIPSFSSKRVLGTSYFDQAKQGKKVPSYMQHIEIQHISVEDSFHIQKKQLSKVLSERIAKVEGNFRQKDVLSFWQKSLTEIKTSAFQIISVKATTSKRTYIRAIVRDLSIKLDTPLTTFHILRTRNGPYQIKDCICLL